VQEGAGSMTEYKRGSEIGTSIRRTPVFLPDTLAGEDVVNDLQKVETRGSAVNILTATTTTIKSAPGHVNRLIAVGGTMGNVTVYDNTAASGTVLFGPATPTAGGTIVENIDFSIGLTVVTAAATAISGSVR